MAKQKRQTSDNSNTGGLRPLNIGLAIVFFVQAILILVLSRNISAPVNTHYLTSDTLASQAAGHTVWAEASHHLFDVRLAYLLALILFIATIFHLLAATMLRPWYEADLKKANRLRWIEYGVNGGLILLAVAFMNGIVDISTLFVLFMLIIGLGLLTLLVEQLGRIASGARWLVNGLAIITGLVPWIIIACYLIDAAIFGASRLPTFVYWLDITIFLLFAATAAIFYGRKHQLGRWADAIYTEKTFMVLGLATKTALAWQIFFGRLR